MKCTRCGKRATETWDVCALGNKPQGICAACDVMLNELVLWFMDIPKRASVIARYRRQKGQG